PLLRRGNAGLKDEIPLGFFPHAPGPRQILTPSRHPPASDFCETSGVVTRSSSPVFAASLASWRLRVEKSARPGGVLDHFFFAPSRKAVREWSFDSASEPVMA